MAPWGMYSLWILRKARAIKVSLLVDASGEQVPCRETHTTCRPITPFFFAHWYSNNLGQGSKVCPFTPMSSSHCKVTREDLQLSLSHTKRLLNSSTKLHQELILKTHSLWSSFCKFGCHQLRCQQWFVWYRLPRGFVPGQCRRSEETWRRGFWRSREPHFNLFDSFKHFIH